MIGDWAVPSTRLGTDEGTSGQMHKYFSGDYLLRVFNFKKLVFMIILKLNGGGTPQDGTKINYRGETYTRKGGGWVDSRGFAASNYL